MENIIEVKLAELHPFPNHPFQVGEDDVMRETVESIQEYSVMTPIIVRNREEGGDEIISGHRRKHACELAGIKRVPVIIRDLDYDSAVIAKKCSVSTVTRAIDELVKKGYVVKENRRRKNGSKTSNVYVCK